MRIARKSCAAALLLVVSSAFTVSGGTYTLIDIGPSSVEAHGINAAGQVVGEHATTYGTRPFVWDPVTGFHDLEALPISAIWGEAHDINDAGQIVGWARVSTGDWLAFSYMPGVGLSYLPTLPGQPVRAYAFAVNPVGLIAGDVGWGGGAHAARWTADGALVDLDGSSGYSWGADINAGGDVVGWVGLENAARWSAGGGLQLLPSLPGLVASRALGMNDAGVIVGESHNGLVHHACMWSAEGVPLDLGDLAGGAESAEARDVNSSGQVVGVGTTAEGARAFVWDSVLGMRELSTLVDDAHADWDLMTANAINDAGWICGWARTPEGYNRAYVLVPEPACGVLLITFFLVLRRSRRTQ